MKIALVAPLVSPITEHVPPLGGAQTFLADLGRCLAARGHGVTLLAARGSCLAEVEAPDLGIDSQRLVPARFIDGAERSDLAEQAESFAAVRDWIDRHPGAVDVIHAHAYDAQAFLALAGARAPVVHTLHLPPLDPAVTAAARVAGQEATLVTVSEWNAEAWRRAGVPIHAVVPNGIDLTVIPYGRPDLGYLLCAGRVAPEKGTDLAIEMAAAAGKPLLLVGGVYDEAFYARAIRPRVRIAPDWRPGDPIRGGATYIGARPRSAVFELMAAASALLMPVRWDEPFGLVAIEAQATGCPVVAFARGGLTTTIRNGHTGWLVPVDDEVAFVQAIGRLVELDRACGRGWVAGRYSLEAIVRAHEDVYRTVRGEG